MQESAVREQIKVKRDDFAAKLARVQRDPEFTADITHKYEVTAALCDRALALPEGKLVEGLAPLREECTAKLADSRQEFSEVKEGRMRESLALFVDYCRRWTARVEK
jgi:ABC-type glutathione transport system ATPase component